MIKKDNFYLTAAGGEIMPTKNNNNVPIWMLKLLQYCYHYHHRLPKIVNVYDYHKILILKIKKKLI